MKILHFSDVHLGAYVGPQCDDPMKRMENTMRCLGEVIKTAKKEQPDIILMTGDMWHASKIWSDRSNVELRTAAELIQQLKIIAPVAVLYGTPNHDSEEMFNNLRWMCADENAWFFDKPETICIDTKSGPIQVAALPGFDKGHFRAQFPGLSAEEENNLFTQQLSQIVAGLSAQIDSSIPAVLMAHHTVVGCELDNGQHVFQANEVVLDAAALDNSAFDLVCLGHIHRAQNVGEPSVKPIFYAGSIDATNFNEEDHIKGFWIHKTNNLTRPNYIETPAREFITLNWSEETVDFYIEYGFDDLDDPEDLKNKVVRVLYTCDSETEKALDKKKLERDLYAAGAYYVSEIRPEKITAAVNQERMTEKMTVEDCLLRYLREKGYETAIIDKLFTEASPIIAMAEASIPSGTTSGMFLPVEISVRNYRSYAEETFNFTDIFFAMVNGRNGIGKSALFMDAITDCLYEQTRENDLTGWIRNGEKSGAITFTFMLGDDMWRVTRTRQRSGKATLALAKLDGMGKGIAYNKDFDLNWKDHSCERFVDTQQKIVDLLGMDCETFQSCILIMQDKYGKFMEANKNDRMNVLGSLLGLGIYDELEKITSDKLRETTRELRTVKAEIATLGGDTQEESRYQAVKDEAIHGIQTASAQKSTNEQEVTEKQSQLNYFEGQIANKRTLEAEYAAKGSALRLKKTKQESLKDGIQQAGEFIAQEPEIIEKAEAYEKAKLDLAAYSGKQSMHEDKRNRLSQMVYEKVQLKNKISITDQKISLVKSSLEEMSELQSKAKNLEWVEEALERYEATYKKYIDANARLTAKSAEVKQYQYKAESIIQSLKNEISSLEKQIAILDDSNCIDIGRAQCRFLASAQDAKAKIATVRTNLEATVQDYNETFSSLKIEEQEIEEYIKDIGYKSDDHNKCLDAVKEYRVTKDLIAKKQSDVLAMEQLKAQFKDDSAKLSDLTAQIEAIEKETIELEMELAGAESLKKTIAELSSYPGKKDELTKAKQYRDSSIEQLVEIEKDIDGLQVDIAKLSDQIREIDLVLNDGLIVMNIRSEIDNRKQLIKQIDSSISSHNQAIGNVNAKLEEMSKKKQQITLMTEKVSEFAAAVSRLEVLQQAFCQDGIPFQIVRDIVPDLQASANEILGQMTAGRMNLSFITEKVLKSNKNKEVVTLDIIINDIDNGILPYMSRSGGQKVRAALAVSFALAMIKANRVGLQLGMMFVDEPPFLDAEGVEAYCAALESIHTRYPEMRIIAISHDENMKSRFPQQITIVSTENGSKVRRG